MPASPSAAISPQLQAAQERLLQRRRQLGPRPTPVPAPPPPTAENPLPETTRAAARLERLPAHLGWGSESLTRALRRPTGARPAATLCPSAIPPAPAGVVPAPSPPVRDRSGTTVLLYPDLALALLQHKQTAAGRIWLLLHHLDRPGRGWLPLAEVRRQLTGRDQSLHVCGWRQLRNLLTAGEGLFWQRRDDRLWLRSTARVAAGLGLPRLQHRPVCLPLRVLTGRIGDLRSHFYASFHSSRGADGRRRPIARRTLRRLSRASRQTQRRYEARAGVARQTNLVLGARLEPAAFQEAAWRRGRSVFLFHDRVGRHGPAGRRYIAWQLPNSFAGPHRCPAAGRLRRLNRRLADLWHQGTAGNDRPPEAARRPDGREQRYFGGGLSPRAARSGRVSPEEPLYWPSRLAGRRAAQIWYGLG